MNPRDFCKEPGYPTAIFLTYNFDAEFFENLILRDLWQGESEEILVIGDRRQIEKNIWRWSGRLRFLGRRYQLVTSTVISTFHPKVYLRLADDRARVAIGSGNLSFGGWGGNMEVATDWTVSFADHDLMMPVRKVARFILESISDDLPSDAPLVRLRELAVDAMENEWQLSDDEVLFSWSEKTLAAQLSARWDQKRFEAVTIFTGSSDENGAFLRWAHEKFGVKSATVIGDPTNLSFLQKQLSELPLKIEIQASTGSRPMHAKAYIFTGPDGSSAVIGSANCSRAAWLLPIDQGGNVESIVVYDDVNLDDLSDLLGIDRQVIQIEDLSDKQISKVDDDTSVRSLLVPKIYWEESTGTMTVQFDPEGPKIEGVSLVNSDDRLPLHKLDDSGKRWSIAFGSALIPFQTNFVLLEVNSGAADAIQVRGWVNDLGELRHASGGRRITSVLLSLASPRDASEYRKIMNDLHEVGRMILTERHLFDDPLIGARARNDKQDDLANKAPIDPNIFLRSLSEIGRGEREHNAAFTHIRGLSLQSVLRAFFGIDEHFADVANEVGPDETDEEISRGTSDLRPMHETEARSENKAGPDDNTRKRIYNDVADFIDRLPEPEFFEHCSAIQLREAVAYPLFVALKGIRSGWCDMAIASEWVTRICDVIFTRVLPRSSERGILAAVRQRYIKEGKGEDFARIVGDGTLWTVLLASLSKIQWTGKNRVINKALALRGVYSSSGLLESTQAERIKSLLSFLDTEQVTFVLDKAREANLSLGRLEAYLGDNFETMKSAQAAQHIPIEEEDILWNSGGWAEVRESTSWGGNTVAYLHAKADETTIKTNFFINLTKLAESDDQVREFVDQISKLVR